MTEANYRQKISSGHLAIYVGNTILDAQAQICKDGLCMIQPTIFQCLPSHFPEFSILRSMSTFCSETLTSCLN